MEVDDYGVDSKTSHGKLKKLIKILDINGNLSWVDLRLKARVVKGDNEFSKELIKKLKVK